MARIKEFRGLRPVKDAEIIAELPYDVLQDDEIKLLSCKNKSSFYHITRPEFDLDENTDHFSETVYQKGKENLGRFVKEGLLSYDSEECLYLYTLIMNGRSQTGLVACTHIDDYENNIIKKHELVLDSKAEDRKNHIDILNANTGLVFLFYRQDGNNKRIFEKSLKADPVYDFITGDGIRHIFRVIGEKGMISEYKDLLKNKNFYIADGHHRAHSAYRVGLERRNRNKNHSGNEEYNWFLSVIFPHDELKILSYNRLVADLNGFTHDEFLGELGKNFVVKEDNSIAERNAFRVYLNRWYKLSPKFKIPDDPVESIDVQILQTAILAPVLGINDPKNDKRICFFPGIREEQEVEKLVDSGKYAAAFILYPVSIDELIRVSDKNLLMPPKSTWFEPKLRSGLVIHTL